jgi:hypothetical protein
MVSQANARVRAISWYNEPRSVIMERDREFYRMRWHEAAEKRFEDFPGIKSYRLGKVLWIGRPGYSASVEAWINKVVEELQVYTDTLSTSKHWFIRCFSSSREKSEQNMVYFGFHTKKGDQELIIACGGATNYSGEGGYAKALAEAFMQDIVDYSLGVVRILDHEIGYLIEYMLEN